jgi:hypothetical protein
LFVIAVKEERIMAAIKNDSRKRGGRKVKKFMMRAIETQRVPL